MTKKTKKNKKNPDTTDALIDFLCKDADGKSTKRLGCPLKKSILWLLISLPVMTYAITGFGLRPDMALQLSNPQFVLETTFAFLTGITATFIVFTSSIPGFWERFGAIPVVFAGLWLASLIAGAYQDMQMMGDNALYIYDSSYCILDMVTFGGPLLILMFLFLRRATPCNPRFTAAMMGLSVFSLTATGWNLHNYVATNLIQLIFHFGMVVIICLVLYAAGRKLLNWQD